VRAPASVIAFRQPRPDGSGDGTRSPPFPPGRDFSYFRSWFPKGCHSLLARVFLSHFPTVLDQFRGFPLPEPANEAIRDSPCRKPFSTWPLRKGVVSFENGPLNFFLAYRQLERLPQPLFVVADAPSPFEFRVSRCLPWSNGPSPAAAVRVLASLVPVSRRREELAFQRYSHSVVGVEVPLLLFLTHEKVCGGTPVTGKSVPLASSPLPSGRLFRRSPLSTAEPSTLSAFRARSPAYASFSCVIFRPSFFSLNPSSRVRFGEPPVFDPPQPTQFLFSFQVIGVPPLPLSNSHRGVLPLEEEKSGPLDFPAGHLVCVFGVLCIHFPKPLCVHRRHLMRGVVMQLSCFAPSRVLQTRDSCETRFFRTPYQGPSIALSPRHIELRRPGHLTPQSHIFLLFAVS